MKFRFSSRNNLILEYKNHSICRIMKMFICINENIYGSNPYGSNPYKDLSVQAQMHSDIVSKRINQLRFGLHELLTKYNPNYKND